MVMAMTPNRFLMLSIDAFSPVCAALLLAATGCSKPAEEAPKPEAPKAEAPAPVENYATIVSSLPRLGATAAQSNSIVNAIRIAVEEAGGKAGDFTLRYEDWDNASAARGDWDPATEVTNAEKAAKDDAVLAYIGPFNSGAAQSSMPILAKAGLAMISPSATYPGLTKPGFGEGEPAKYRAPGAEAKVNFFRVIPTDEIQGAHAVEWIAGSGGGKVLLLDDGDTYGKGIADVFAKAAADQKIGIDRRATWPKLAENNAGDAKALEAFIKGLAKSKAEWIYIAGSPQSGAAEVAKLALAAFPKAKLMLPDGNYDKALLDAIGAAGDDRAFVTFSGFSPDSANGKGLEFVTKYEKRFGQKPGPYAVYGYVAATVAIKAIATVNAKDREKVRAAVAATKQSEGPLGYWYFDDNGDTTSRLMSGSVVKGGQFTFVKFLGLAGEGK
jgi:branched-chain amino acid transport system substrate-binding protein